MYRILIAEDEEPIANLIRMNLKKAGYSCVWAADGEEAANFLESEPFDLVLLDIMLPKIDGYELIGYANSLSVPVIFLTALGSTQQKVKGLKLGAEDYLTKPFEIAELLARVEVVLRRYHKADAKLRVFDIVIDTVSRTVEKNGEQIRLTLKEYDLLLLLARNRNIALYRDRIYEQVWGGDSEGMGRTVDIHIQRLKKKLDWNKEISTIYKVGYRLEGEDSLS
ncbi:MAG: response regulator transcription factor [Lachnospiraceae bacterium]|nr:response regulator transcription factor [Lachnospiraceae bacterium]